MVKRHSIRKRIKQVLSNPKSWEAVDDFFATVAVLAILAVVSVVIGHDILELF